MEIRCIRPRKFDLTYSEETKRISNNVAFNETGESPRENFKLKEDLVTNYLLLNKSAACFYCFSLPGLITSL